MAARASRSLAAVLMVILMSSCSTVGEKVGPVNTAWRDEKLSNGVEYRCKFLLRTGREFCVEKP